MFRTEHGTKLSPLQIYIDAIDERSRGVSNRMDLTANTHTHVFHLRKTVSYRLITKNYRNKTTLWKLLKKASNRFVLDCMHFYTIPLAYMVVIITATTDDYHIYVCNNNGIDSM